MKMENNRRRRTLNEQIAGCVEDAAGKTEPELQEMGCPYCDGTAKLIKGPFEIIEQGFRWSGHHWKYFCDKCGEGFTTTESDTLSLASLKEVNNND